MAANKTICLALVATFLVCCMVMGEAVPNNRLHGRSLLQDCGAVRSSLAGNCDALCSCVAEQEPYKSNPRPLDQCTTPCNQCVTEAQSCAADSDPLPGTCASYSGDPAVQACTGQSGRRLF